jgi:hypothetical protein
VRDRPTLLDIGRSHGCDKFTLHHYESVYVPFLEPLRDKPLKLLEIGVGGEGLELGGASLLTWSDYFSSAEIVGIDIHDKSALDTSRITTVVCDQGSPEQLSSLAAQLGPFDVVIDDGSHFGHDVAISLFSLFASLTDGGMYFIEDIQTSYWPEYGGSSVAPMAYDTATRWIKLAVDVINRAEILDPSYFPLRAGFHISELHVYHNIAVLLAAEGSPPTSAIVDEERRARQLAVDREANATRAETHDRLLADPLLLGQLLDAISRLGGLDSVLGMSAEGMRSTGLKPSNGE